MNDLNFGSSTGPSSSTPPIGLGRSSTHTSLPYCAADSITYAIVDTYVYGRAPTSWMSNSITSMPSSISLVGCRVLPYRLCTGRPVFSSVDEPTVSPARTVPRMPCSGPKSAFTSICPLRCTASTSGSPVDSTPLGFVTMPIVRPRRSRHASRTNTSSPSKITAFSFMICGRTAGSVARAADGTASAAAVAARNELRCMLDELRVGAGGDEVRLRGAREEVLDGGDARIAHVVAVLVDVEPDVRAHHVVVHLERVRANVADDLALAFACKAKAAPDRVVDRARVVVGDVTPHEDRAERDRVAGRRFPPVAQVDGRHEAGVLVGEARLVDDEPAGDVAVLHRVDDPVEPHLDGARLAPERQAQQRVRGREATGDREHGVVAEVRQQGRLSVDAGLRDHERPAAAPERAAGPQDAVLVEQIRDRAVAHFRQLVPAGARGAVQRLDVVEHHVHLRRAVEQAVRERREDVGVVRAR